MGKASSLGFTEGGPTLGLGVGATEVDSEAGESQDADEPPPHLGSLGGRVAPFLQHRCPQRSC